MSFDTRARREAAQAHASVRGVNPMVQLEELKHEVKTRRRTGVALTAAVVAVVVAGAGWLAATRLGVSDNATVNPADDSKPSEVAASFIRTAYAYDLNRASAMLSGDADVYIESGDAADWRDSMAWNKAVGFSLAHVSCPEGTATATGTEVRCAYALHALGSKELGRGPYEGTFVVTVRDGKITRASEDFPFDENGFSDEMWEPFQAWVYQEHPSEARVMWEGNQSAAGIAQERRLFEKNIPEYVAAHQ